MNIQLTHQKANKLRQKQLPKRSLRNQNIITTKYLPTSRNLRTTQTKQRIFRIQRRDIRIVDAGRFIREKGHGIIIVRYGGARHGSVDCAIGDVFVMQRHVRSAVLMKNIISGWSTQRDEIIV